MAGGCTGIFRGPHLTARRERRAASAATSTLPRGPSLESGLFPTSPVEVGEGFPLRWASPPYPGRMGLGKELRRARPHDLRPSGKRAEENRFTRSLPNWGLGKYAVITQEPRPL